MHHPTDRIAHTTAFVTPVVEHWLEREIAQWVHHMKDRYDDPPHHELRPAPTLLLCNEITQLFGTVPCIRPSSTTYLFSFCNALELSTRVNTTTRSQVPTQPRDNCDHAVFVQLKTLLPFAELSCVPVMWNCYRCACKL